VHFKERESARKRDRGRRMTNVKEGAFWSVCIFVSIHFVGAQEEMVRMDDDGFKSTDFDLNSSVDRFGDLLCQLSEFSKNSYFFFSSNPILMFSEKDNYSTCTRTCACAIHTQKKRNRLQIY